MKNRVKRYAAWGSREKCMLAAGYLFALTFQKYLTRDPLSQSTGLQGVLETVLILLTFLIAVFLSRGMPKRIGLHLSLLLFGIYGAFALASSINSFNLKMSLVKAILYFAVLLTAYFVAELQMSLVFLNGVYRCYIATLLGALALSVIAPGRYPLFLVDAYSGRTRLNLLATHPNSIGEVSGLLFLVAQVLPIRTRWYWQAFLIGINIYAGEKTATAALVLCAGMIYLAANRKISQILGGAVVLAALFCIVLLAFKAGVVSGLSSTSFAHAAESIYGTKVSTDMTTLDGRTEVWAKGVELARGCVGLGYGFDGVRELLVKDVSWSGHAHNGILQAALSSGIFGLLALLAGWFAAVRDSLGGGRIWNVRVLSLNLYIFLLAMIGPVFDSPSYFTILLFIFVLYAALEAKGTLNLKVPLKRFRLNRRAYGALPGLDCV